NPPHQTQHSAPSVTRNGLVSATKCLVSWCGDSSCGLQPPWRRVGVNCSEPDAVGTHPKIVEKEFRRDAGGFKNYRQSTAWMRSATDEIHAVEILEPVVRPAREHLIETVRK